MNNLSMAKSMMGSQKSNPGQTTTAYGVATSRSVGGLVMVDMGGDTVSPDDDQSIECETTFKVFEGDEVIVSLVGADGSGKTPTVIGVVGRGDQMQSEIDNVKNYFWTNDRGAHISTIEHSVAGNNVLIDSDSLDVRYGNTNNENDQILLARFGRNTAYIGGVDGTPYWTIKDLRSADTGYATVEDIKYGDGVETSFITDFDFIEIISVTKDGIELEVGDDYTIDSTASLITFVAVPPASSELIITYTTSDGIFSYSEGIRKSGIEGPYSKSTGLFNTASGSYSQANGYTTQANGWAADTNGYLTVADSRLQRVFGQANVIDSNNKYIEIVGNGRSAINEKTETIITDGETSQFTMTEAPYQIVSATASGSGDPTYFGDYRVSVIPQYYSRGVYVVVHYEWDKNIPAAFGANFYYNISFSVNGTTTTRNSSVTATGLAGDTYFNWQILVSNDPTAIISDEEVVDSRITLLYFRNIQNDITKNDYVITLPEYLYTSTGLNVQITYTYGGILRSNAYNLDWSGNAEYKGAIFMSGCTPNGDTPYSATRFNHTDYKLQYYYNGTLNKRWVTLQEYYNNGFYIGQEVGIMAMGNGMITDSGKQIQLQFVLPNPVFDPSMIEEAVILIMIGGMRGIKGYINSSAYNTDWGALLETSGYSYELKVVGTNTMSLIINKTSAFTNYTNNTPINFNLLELSIGFNRYLNPPVGS